MAEKLEKLKSIEEPINKFSDLIFASTSSNCEEICLWEPKTLAPYESISVIYYNLYLIGLKVYFCT